MNLVNELRIGRIVQCPSCNKRKTTITLYFETRYNALHAFLDCVNCCDGEKLFVTTSFLLKNIKKDSRIIIGYNGLTTESLLKLMNESIIIEDE